MELAFTHKGASKRGAQSNSFMLSSRPTKHFNAEAAYLNRLYKVKVMSQTKNFDN